MTIDVKDANGNIVTIPTPSTAGRAAAAASKPVSLSNEDKTALDALATQTTLAAVLAKIIAAPATETTAAAILAKLIAAPATEVSLAAALATLGGTTGAAVITDANGTVQQYLRGLVKQWIAGTLVVGAGTNLLGKVKTKFIAAAGTALTRPANTTAYTANDAISDNATIGSVTAKSITVSDVNDDTITLERMRLDTNDTGIGGKSVRVYLYNSDPTANSGVQAGDNAAFSNKRAGLIGRMSGTFTAMSDGAFAVLVPDEGSRIIAAPTSGARTIYWQLQALDAFTPSANSTTFTPTAEGFQGAA